MFQPPRLARSALACVLCCLAWASQPAAAEEPQPAPKVPKPEGDAYRPIGPELFPFYEHYVRTADSTTVRNILYLYTATDNPDLSWSRLLAPIFYRAHKSSPESDLFFLFPLLFFHKSSQEETYNYWIPFFYDRRTQDLSLQFLFPLWLHTRTADVSRHHVLFPLFRLSSDASDPARPMRGTRFGLWKILELWESRTEPEATERAAFNFFNWKPYEAQGGWALYRSSWSRDGERLSGHTHLLPFYWHTDEPGTVERWIFPLYGYHQGPGSTDLFLPPLLSRIGGSADGERRLDVLFPLFHYASGPKRFSTFSFPLFGYSRDESEVSWNVLFWPYRTTTTLATGKRTHSIFFPLSHFDIEPDHSKGSRWFFPYIETFNEKRLWRFGVPLYYEYQSLAGGNTDWYFRTGLPLYYSWGYPDDYFSMGFPLYWASRSGSRGWRVFVPFFLDSYSATARGLHILPLVSYRSFPSRKQLYLLGPLYIHERFYDLQKERSGTGNHLLWPLFAVENRKDGYLYRALPFFWTSREGDTSDLLLTPFYYEQDGPRGKHRYFAPFYGRYESPHLEREFYGAGAYMRTREPDSAGGTARVRDDVLWGLASFEKDHARGAVHSHILPFGYWSTHSPAEDRTVVGPLFYSHRITEGGYVHHLHLVLGNLFLSKVVEEAGVSDAAAAPIPESRETVAASPGEETAPAETSPVESTALLPTKAAENTAANVGRPADSRAPPTIASSDKGILWPLSRWYREKDTVEGRWVIPFYFQGKGELSSHLALFPLFFNQHQETPYQLSYFRYFFLADRETWREGHRFTFGQFLFDWMADNNTESRRLRLFYPLYEQAWDRTSYSFQLTPFFRLSSSENRTDNYLFPIFWQGSTRRRTASGEDRYETKHFFLFPLYGFQDKATRVDHYVLFPLVHFQTSDEAFRFELWPTFFYRDEASLLAVRLWPLHTEERGATAGDFWISRYLFLSKHFRTADTTRYRLDPFLFRVSSGPDAFGIGGLFEAFAYDRSADEFSLRLFPFAFGYSRESKTAFGVIPFHYWKDFGREEIDYDTFWRHLFLSQFLEGANGDRYFSLLWVFLWKLDNPNRPDFLEMGFLHRLIFRRHSETSSQLKVHPFFTYYRDDVSDETRYSVLYSLYSYERTRGRPRHTLFYFFHF